MGPEHSNALPEFACIISAANVMFRQSHAMQSVVILTTLRQSAPCQAMSKEVTPLDSYDEPGLKV